MNRFTKMSLVTAIVLYGTKTNLVFLKKERLKLEDRKSNFQILKEKLAKKGG